MKKLLFSLKGLLFLATVLLLAACSSPVNLPEDGEAEILINGADLTSENFGFYERKLLENEGENVTIAFSCDMFVVNNSNGSANLMWQIYQPDINQFPMISFNSFNKGNSGWTSISGSADVTLTKDNYFYLSTYQLTPADFKIYIKNFKLVVTSDSNQRTYTANGETAKENSMSDDNWLNEKVPSLCKTYESYIPRVGFASTGTELESSSIQKGLKKHGNTTTMGNEFKPQFICAWWGQNPKIAAETFTASNGQTISVPVLNGLSNFDKYLGICKTLGIKMRGHVLVWHSQTEDAFFCEDYDSKKELVTPEVMTARQEWYIKTVLEYVDNWEKTNNNGEHIIWAWDVVNEAVADDASGGTYLRGSTSGSTGGSKWYSIYKSDEFIVNAFRFANKYAPADVKLCYNDYNEYQSNKMPGILSLLDSIIAAKNDATLPTRIDVMGMQSHTSVNTSAATYETAVKEYIAKGLDIHVTELDIATESSYDPDQLAKHYKDYFTVFLNNRKTDTSNGIECVTIWGYNDETTWLNTESQIKWHGNCTQYPLLLEKNSDGEMVIKKAFTSVIEAATSY